MSRPHLHVDWEAIAAQHAADVPAADSRRRMRVIFAVWTAAFLLVIARAVQLEISDGENFRRLAAQPIVKPVVVAAQRGRILARDGTVLAEDRAARALALQYRYLESPPDPRWLRRQARARLTRAERREPAKVAAAEAGVRRELSDLHRRLAALCKLDDTDWQARTQRVQRRVAALADRVNRARAARFRELTTTTPDDPPLSFRSVLAGLFSPPERLPPAEVTVAEELDWHPIVDDLPPEACQAILDQPDAFPGVKIVEHPRRTYPHESLAANLLGHVGPPVAETSASGATAAAASDPAVVGRMGIELASEVRLHGRAGRERQTTDRRGHVLAIDVEQAAIAGEMVVLTIDPALQGFAEQLLDRALEGAPDAAARGGAVAVVDVHTGELLAAAAAPRFDPNWFAGSDPRAAAALADPRRPLFDRATRMAIPPGSVFKAATAIALLAQGVVDPASPFHCQGYLHEPDSFRCQLFRQQGIGHGAVTLAGALAQSCNVYFFHHAERLGPAALLDWSTRLGLAETVAQEVSGTFFDEGARGRLPTAAELGEPGQLAAFAIGQGTLTATPLEIVRLYAAIANGGYLVPIRITRDTIAPAPPHHAPRSMPVGHRIAGLDARVLAAVREGLRQAVADPAGTAHAAAHLSDLPIAGKTGTAEAGGDRPDHAWFAGYAPADAPRYAFVVALEHGGPGTAAASLARPLVVRMRQLGYLPPPAATARSYPPGKG